MMICTSFLRCVQNCNSSNNNTTTNDDDEDDDGEVHSLRLFFPSETLKKISAAPFI